MKPSTLYSWKECQVKITRSWNQAPCISLHWWERLRKKEGAASNALCNKGWHFWKGGFVTDKTGLKIFVFINAMIFAFTTFVTNTPLYGKIASKVWKIYFQYISPHFLDAAGSQISDLWLLLLSNSSLFSALMSHLPLLLLHSAVIRYILHSYWRFPTWK